MTRSTPPNADEFEISVIGPGRGECILIHLGDNEWCVVDSCTSRRRRAQSEPVAVEYLSSFGNGAVDRIRMVVATHWHDDHIRGLTSLLELVPTASFFCSAALDSENFWTLVDTAATGIQRSSGMEEFGSIYRLIHGRAPIGHAKKLATPKWASENRKLLRLTGDDRPFSVSVTALSPSDGTRRLAFLDIARLLPRTGETQSRITGLDQNHASVVLWIEAGPLRALLGADLEHTGHEGEGWMAVLAGHQDRQPAALFKVPHHGSANADYPEVWDKMLEENPIAIVTPFRSVALPKESDLRRLEKRTGRLYCTAEGPGKPPARDAVVEKTMRQQVKERRVIEGQPGHVRVRWSIKNQGDGPAVDLFHGAYPVKIAT